MFRRQNWVTTKITVEEKAKENEILLKNFVNLSVIKTLEVEDFSTILRLKILKRI